MKKLRGGDRNRTCFICSLLTDELPYFTPVNWLTPYDASRLACGLPCLPCCRLIRASGYMRQLTGAQNKTTGRVKPYYVERAAGIEPAFAVSYCSGRVSKSNPRKNPATRLWPDRIH